jgi:hypothetical protein
MLNLNTTIYSIIGGYINVTTLYTQMLPHILKYNIKISKSTGKF